MASLIVANTLAPGTREMDAKGSTVQMANPTTRPALARSTAANGRRSVWLIPQVAANARRSFPALSRHRVHIAARAERSSAGAGKRRGGIARSQRHRSAQPVDFTLLIRLHEPHGDEAVPASPPRLEVARKPLWADRAPSILLSQHDGQHACRYRWIARVGGAKAHVGVGAVDLSEQPFATLF
jgi:hypothetical protein